MMLNVAANFDDEYVDEVSNFPEVRVLFGRLATDFVGGGCESALLKDISQQRLEEYVRRARRKGIAFNYVINSPSTNNEEYSTRGKGELNRLLEFLCSLELESATVANPFLVLYIKKNFPNLRLKASANFAIDSVEKAKYVRSIGIDILVLDPLLVNRDFASLRAIRQALGDEIEILVNNNCLMNCPFLGYHQNYLGATSRGTQQSNAVDFCYAHCSRMRVSDPISWIKGDWVRPEDVGRYEEIGYTRFKVTDRCAPKEVLLQRIRAYARRKYDGNLLNLLQHYYYRDSIAAAEYAQSVHIDGAKLDGFLDFFVNGHCNGRDCDPKCGHCASYAKRAVHIGEEFRSRWKETKDREIERLLSP